MKAEILKEKRLTVLEDTIKYFNTNTRCQGKGGCQYSPIKGKSEGCAIGRLVKDKKLCSILDKMGGVSLQNVFVKLPQELKQLGQEFLIDLQHLHDSSVAWNENGLTEFGKQTYSAIKSRI